MNCGIRDMQVMRAVIKFIEQILSTDDLLLGEDGINLASLVRGQ
jgi:hypothetical protein